MRPRWQNKVDQQILYDIHNSLSLKNKLWYKVDDPAMQVMSHPSFVPTLSKKGSRSLRDDAIGLSQGGSSAEGTRPVKTGSKHSGTRHLRGYPCTEQGLNN